MYTLGLTGSIGMGKSTVAKMFVECGLRHWDADLEVHRLYGWQPYVPNYGKFPYPNGPTKIPTPDPGPQIRQMLKKEFGDILVDDTLTAAVDREKLKAMVAADAFVLNRLSEILSHPLKHSAYAMGRVGSSQDTAVLYDVPLLFEGEMSAFIRGFTEGPLGSLYRTIVVSCPAEVQRERVLQRPGMTQERLDHILARQMPDEDKRALADFIIDTSGTFDSVRVQVQSIATKMKLSA